MTVGLAQRTFVPEVSNIISLFICDRWNDQKIITCLDNGTVHMRVPAVVTLAVVPNDVTYSWHFKPSPETCYYPWYDWLCDFA